MSTVEATKKRSSAVSPFAIEIVGNACCNMVIQSIPGCKLRGAVKSVKEVCSPLTPGPDKQSASSGVIPGVPELPGMQLYVYPNKCQYKIVDPMYDNKELCSVVTLMVQSKTGVKLSGEGINGVPPVEATLETSRIKTLVREMVYLVETEKAKLHKGVLPQIEDIEKLPGKFLLNPGSSIPNTQPRYEEDLEDWINSSNKVGG